MLVQQLAQQLVMHGQSTSHDGLVPAAGNSGMTSMVSADTDAMLPCRLPFHLLILTLCDGSRGSFDCAASVHVMQMACSSTNVV